MDPVANSRVSRLLNSSAHGWFFSLRAFTTHSLRIFQAVMVRGKYEYLYVSTRECPVILYWKLWLVRISRLSGFGVHSV